MWSFDEEKIISPELWLFKYVFFRGGWGISIFLYVCESWTLTAELELKIRNSIKNNFISIKTPRAHILYVKKL